MDCELGKIIRLNVGGVVYQCYESTLQTFPNSLLANLDESCENFNLAQQEYFFDRNPQLFNSILDAYRTGTVHLPRDMCGTTFKAELDFWGLSTQQVSPCCWSSLYRSEEEVQTFSILEDYYKVNTGMCLMAKEKKSLRKKIWLFLHEPKSSTYAKIWAVFMSVIISTSVLIFAVESMHSVRTENYTAEERRNIDKMLDMLGWRITDGNISDYIYSKPHPIIPIIDASCFFILTVELVLVIIVCPCRLDLLKDWMHVAEVICTISFWFSFSVKQLLRYIDSFVVMQMYIILRYVTILKLVRLFRIARHTSAMKIMGLTLSVSKQELRVLVLMLFILSSFFGVLMYVVEFRVHENNFDNVFSAMYWAVITLTTVGYGDHTPKSELGHMVAILCSVFGVLMLAIPVGIIASVFHSLYKHHRYARRYIQDSRSLPWPCS